MPDNDRSVRHEVSQKQSSPANMQQQQHQTEKVGNVKENLQDQVQADKQTKGISTQQQSTNEEKQHQRAREDEVLRAPWKEMDESAANQIKDAFKDVRSAAERVEQMVEGAERDLKERSARGAEERPDQTRADEKRTEETRAGERNAQRNSEGQLRDNEQQKANPREEARQEPRAETNVKEAAEQGATKQKDAEREVARKEGETREREEPRKEEQQVAQEKPKQEEQGATKQEDVDKERARNERETKNQVVEEAKAALEKAHQDVEREMRGARRDVADARRMARLGEQNDAVAKLQERAKTLADIEQKVQEAQERSKNEQHDVERTPAQQHEVQDERRKAWREKRKEDEQGLQRRANDPTRVDEARIQEKFREVAKKADSVFSELRRLERRQQQLQAEESKNASTQNEEMRAELAKTHQQYATRVTKLYEDLDREMRGTRQDIAARTIGADEAIANLSERRKSIERVQVEVEQERAEEELHALVDVVAPYKQLARRTGCHNKRMEAFAEREGREIELEGDPQKLEDFQKFRNFTTESTKLDAEHFIDGRFFEPFKDEFMKIGIKSTDEMPTFAVHTEYHRRSPKSLSEEAGYPKEKQLRGLSLTDQKEAAIPLENAKQRYGTLTAVIDKFEKFWKGEPGYWKRIEKEFPLLRECIKEEKDYWKTRAAR